MAWNGKNKDGLIRCGIFHVFRKAQAFSVPGFNKKKKKNVYPFSKGQKSTDLILGFKIDDLENVFKRKRWG